MKTEDRPTPEEREKRCRNYFAAQNGLISRKQAHAAGHHDATLRTRIAAGTWRRVLPTVFGLAGSPDTPEQRCRAALLWAGSGSALSHETAGWLWGLFLKAPERTHVAVTSGSSLPAPWHVHQVETLDNEIRLRRGFQVTCVERTLRDLAYTRKEDEVESFVWDAIRLKHTTAEKIAAYAENNPRCGGRRLLRAVNGGRMAVRSLFEARLPRVIVAAGLPAPLPAIPICENGKQIYELDFGYPEVALAIELDSTRWHGSPGAIARDRERQNKLVSMGWEPLRFAWSDLAERPDYVVKTIASKLGDIDAHDFLLARRRPPAPSAFERGEVPDLQLPLFSAGAP